MAINIGTYVDPGAYVSEVIVPSAVSSNTVPLVPTLIGVGSRLKRVNNEALLRGNKSQTLVVSSAPGAHTAPLTEVGNRVLSQTVVYKDGVALDNSNISYSPASITGATLTTLDFTTNNLISLSMDGKTTVTIKIVDGGADLTTISGSLITQRLASIDGTPLISAITATIIAEGLNKALAGASTLGYGATYSAVATVDTNKVMLTSPVSGSTSDVVILVAHPAANSQTLAVFGGSARHAETLVKITNAAYSSTSVYTIDYVSNVNVTNSFSTSNVQTVNRVGDYVGTPKYIKDKDFTFTAGTNYITWISSAPSFTGSNTETFDVSVNDTIKLSFDGKTPIDVDLNGLLSPPPGYANPATPAAATASELAANINAVLANSVHYGPAYKGACTVSAFKLALASPTLGTSGSISIDYSACADALFGISADFETYGVGSSPAPGSTFYASYSYTRLDSDYNVPKRYFSPDALYADIGSPSASNQLAVASEICFGNGSPSVLVIQVNDSINPGSPTRNEIKAALDAAKSTSLATDIVVLDTRISVQSDVIDHVVSQCSSTEKNYRRGWFSMPIGTQIGDKDTEGTYVHRATQTLQVPADSPGRGRLILVAPSGVNYTTILEDGSEATLTLDGTYVAAAIVALMSTFQSPSETLLRKSIAGFVVDDGTFPTYLKSERAMLASNGVCVVTLDGGRLILTDPITTEVGGGKLLTFEEISASVQKDVVSTNVTQAMDANLVGVVPTDIDSFILYIKRLLGAVLSNLIAVGSIAPFQTNEGKIRDVDLATDIQVYQDKTNQTRYFVRYWFSVRLPCKRLFGEYSVNTPFF